MFTLFLEDGPDFHHRNHSVERRKDIRLEANVRYSGGSAELLQLPCVYPGLCRNRGGVADGRDARP